MNKITNTLQFSKVLNRLGQGGRQGLCKQSLDKRQETTWTGCQSLAGVKKKKKKKEKKK